MKKYVLIFFAGLLISCSDSSPRFQRLSADLTGISFSNSIVETDSFHILNNEYIYNGGGVGIGDLNNDGLQDIIFVGNMVSTRVYLNSGNFQFEDVTSSFEGLSNNQWYSGVVMIDINSDGWLDVYLTATANNNPVKRKNRLWVSQGSGDEDFPVFREMAEAYGIADEGYSIHAGFLDYDLDGDLDLYILNNVVDPEVSRKHTPKIDDGTAINNDKFYRNNGNGSFTDVTIEAGIVYEGFGLGLAIGDVNKDGYPDIFVANDYISNDLLYINQGNGTFRNESKKYLSYNSKFSMGTDMADVNNDGNPDIMSLDMNPEPYFKKKQTINGNSYFFYVNDEKYGYERQYVRNMLHLHNGFVNGEMLPFSEVGQMMGIYQTGWSWSPLFADFDNDGDKDLLITNGFPKDLTDKDYTKFKAKVHGYVASDRMVINRIPATKISNYAFENTGDFSFVNRTEAWGMDIPSFSYGASFVDLDNDGDLDYVVNNLNDEAFVYKNNTIERADNQANYIRIRLKGKKGNTMALGAKVELWYNGQYQFYEHFLSRGYTSSVDPIIHFGLPGSDAIDSIKITWPTGKNISIMKNVKAGQLIEINEMTSKTEAYAKYPLYNADLLFVKRDDVINYTHRQIDYIDFFLDQNILPHKFSQIGPIMAKGDLDGDNREDLVIGATNELPTTVFLRKNHGFDMAAFEGLTGRKKCMESDLVILDIDGDGDNDVIALAGGYANENTEDYIHYLYENMGGTFKKIPLPLPPFPASVVKPFDFDHDGDIDLFVGARVKREMFPLATNSYVLINTNGKFSTDPAFTFDLGMVTDAVWSDYDGDGWEDLLITREWNSLAVIKNTEGKELRIETIPVIEKNHGIWYALAAGDFDQDGDDDYIVGNLGENHRFHVSDKYPMKLYSIDLDQNGTIVPLISGYWEDPDGIMKEYPVNYLDELAAQSRFFRRMFNSYTLFSYATIDDILGESRWVADRKYHHHVNTTSSFILWNDNGDFRWEKLPMQLQIAPITKMMVRDFNGDNYPDVLIAGNDHSYDVSTGYYDANKGFVLLSRGASSSFEVLLPPESGLWFQGQIGSLLYFEGDTSLVVGGINRKKIVVYEHKK